jgi:transcriptional regulator with XRE-family HTH domain
MVSPFLVAFGPNERAFQREMTFLPEQCRAARGLVGWTQTDLAERAGVSRSTIRDFECGRHALHRATEAQLVRALDAAGVDLIGPCEAEGPGVRLKRPRNGA